ncbi:DUF6062 family protein [Natronospora cellulosivora (SeqCode)]
MPRSIMSVDLEDALHEEKCPICRLKRINSEKFLWNLIYDATSDPGVHKQFKKSYGFCNDHNQLVIKVIKGRDCLSATSVARLYETLIPVSLKMLNGLKNKQTHGIKEQISKLIRFKKRIDEDEESPSNRFKKEKCMVCQTIDQNVQALEKTLIENLREESFRNIYKESDGLCLPHFQETLELTGFINKKVYYFLINDQEKRLNNLLEKVIKVQKKKSYDNFERVTQEEAFAWQEAIWRYTGWKPEKILTSD